MSKIKLIFTGIFLLSLINVYGQKGVLSGVVIDSSTNDKIPFTTISVYDEEFKLITGTVSNDKGKFRIDKLEFGDLHLVVSFIGYNSDTLRLISLTNNNPSVNFGEIILASSSVELDDVEVRGMASTVSRKIDRQTYRASDFETAQGGTAVDVLNKLPSVSVDPNGVVSVRGTTDFMVYLNGKPTQMDPSMLLGQIAGNTIDNIEVITVPTAKYDAQGKGGIINITTIRTGAEGLSISANGLFGGAPWGHLTDKYSGFEQNDKREGAGLNLMWFKNNLSIYGGLNLNNRNINGLRIGDARILVDEANGVYKHMVAQGERPEWFKYLSANAGFDYQLSDKSTISGSYFFGKRREGRSAFYIYNIFYADKYKNPIAGVDRNEDWIYNPNTDNRYGTFHTANVDFTQIFDDKSKLKISLLYESSGLSRELENLNFDYNTTTDLAGAKELHYKQTDDTPLKGYRASIDFSKELDNGHTLGIGLQPQIFNIAGGFGYDTLGVANNNWAAYSSLENEVEQTRGIYATYIDYAGSTGDLSFIAGLRLEYTDQEMDIIKADYFSIFDGQKQSNYKVNKLDWFPTLHLNYKLSERDQLSFATSRRISRPPIKNMAPFLYRRHLEVYVAGDPQLEPEYLTNFELTFDKKAGNQSFSLTGFYRGVDNAIFRVNTITNENQRVLDVVKEEVLIRSYTNSGNTRALGAELNANLVAGSFAKFFVGGSLYNFKVDSDIFGYQSVNKSTNWSLKANMNLMLSKALKFTTDFNMQSATITAQGQNDLFYMANSALSFTPQKTKGWSFSLRALDILSSNLQGLDTRAFNSNGSEIFYQETEYHRQGPIVELGVTYSLNMNGKSNKKADSTFGKEQF
jgi:outer membrane receptor protein involved in Fe transport